MVDKKLNLLKGDASDKPVKKPRKQFTITRSRPSAYVPIPQKLDAQYKLAEDMVAFAKNNEIVDLDLFPLSLDMSPYRFYKLADKNDYFCEALEVARYHISKRMKAGWCTREFDAKYCSEFLPEVNHYYRSWITHKATLNAQAKQEQKPTQVTVVLDQIQATSLVPERIEHADKLRNTGEAE